MRLSLLLPILFNVIFALNIVQAQPAQSPFNFYAPLKSYQGLSGTFGEIRSGSIHTGLDFRTGGQVGLPVFATDIGYVARVKISSVGYGKAIYIAHPNGTTTVYAHMHKFSDRIEQYVKAEQYKNRNFEIDIHLSSNELAIARGEVIGFSGNTGSSGGPHLHFEVRDTKTQEPLNPFFSNLGIIDETAPVVRSVWLYSLSNTPPMGSIDKRQEIKVDQKNGSYSCADTLLVSGNFGIGIETYDFLNGQSLRCGVYSIKMFVNKLLLYHFAMDRIAFSESRYANSHLDFAMNYENEKRVHKLFTEPNNRLSAYKVLKNRGIIQTEPNNTYNVKIEVSDAQGNTTQLHMVVKGIDRNPTIPKKASDSEQRKGILWPFFQVNKFSIPEFSITMPAKSLYSSSYFNYLIAKSPLQNAYSPVITVGNPLVPVHRNYSLTIRTLPIEDTLKSKALIASVDRKGKITSVGGTYKDGYVSTNVNFFGDFVVLLDTNAPEVKLLTKPQGNNFSNLESIQFKVTDDLSGIARYEGTINGEWALFEYDKKNDLIFYEFDPKRLTKGNEHKLVLTVLDGNENTTVYSYTFQW